MTTRPTVRTSLFPRTPLQAATDALSAATRARTATGGARAVASLTAAGRAAEARHPALRRLTRPAKPAPPASAYRPLTLADDHEAYGLGAEAFEGD